MSRKLKPEFFVHFMNGEVPAFGDGFRGVAVTKTGNKWVYLVATGDQTPARMAKSVWDELPKHVVKRGKLTGEVLF